MIIQMFQTVVRLLKVSLKQVQYGPTFLTNVTLRISTRREYQQNVLMYSKVTLAKITSL